MATEKYYHDIDMVGVSQLKNARKHNVTQAQMDALATVLGQENVGLFIYNTDTQESSTWTGSQFKIDAPKVMGAMVYKGAISAPDAMPSDVLAGYSYMYTGPAATLSWADQTFEPRTNIQTNDMIIYRGENVWDIYDGYEELATETMPGIAMRASIANTKAGIEADTFVTPAGLSAFVSSHKLTTVYFADNLALSANVPLTIQHNMNLQFKDAFTIRVADSTGASISTQSTSVDVNSITLTSSVDLSGVKVTIVGF